MLFTLRFMYLVTLGGYPTLLCVLGGVRTLKRFLILKDPLLASCTRSIIFAIFGWR